MTAQNLNIAIAGDSHSVYVQGNGNSINVCGKNIHLRVNGENNKVHVLEEGAILYSTSKVSLGGPSKLGGLGDLNSPDCPAVLPSKLKRDPSLRIPANHWFLDMVFARKASGTPNPPVKDEDSDGNQNDEDAEGDSAPEDPSHSRTNSGDGGDSANSVTENGSGTQRDEDTTSNSRKRTIAQAGLSIIECIEKNARKFF